MSKPKEADNPAGKPVPSKEQRGIGAVQLLVNATTLGAAVITFAIGGPKLPPLQGD